MALKDSTVHKLAGSGHGQWGHRLDELPTLPVVAQKVTTLLQEPRSHGAQIAEVLSHDPVLTAKILKLVNTPYYSVPGGVTSVSRALAFLGFNTVSQLVLSVSVVNLFSAPAKGGRAHEGGFSVSSFWKTSLARAVVSRRLAKVYGEESEAEMAFTCGLLYEIGQMGLYVLGESTQDQKAVTSLSLALAEKWGLPKTMQKTWNDSGSHIFQTVDLAHQWVLGGLTENTPLAMGHIQQKWLHSGESKGFEKDGEGFRKWVVKLREEIEKAGALLSL